MTIPRVKRIFFLRSRSLIADASAESTCPPGHGRLWAATFVESRWGAGIGPVTTDRTRNAQQGKLYQDQSRGRVRDSRTRPLLLTSRPDDGPVGESGPGLRHAATGGFDLALGRRGHLVDGHGDGDREVPVPQHLDGLALADRTGGHELGHADLAALREQPLDVGHVDDLEHDLVPVLEALE